MNTPENIKVSTQVVDNTWGEIGILDCPDHYGKKVEFCECKTCND